MIGNACISNQQDNNQKVNMMSVDRAVGVCFSFIVCVSCLTCLSCICLSDCTGLCVCYGPTVVASVMMMMMTMMMMIDIERGLVAGVVHAVPDTPQHVLPDEHHSTVHSAVHPDVAGLLRST